MVQSFEMINDHWVLVESDDTADSEVICLGSFMLQRYIMTA